MKFILLCTILAVYCTSIANAIMANPRPTIVTLFGKKIKVYNRGNAFNHVSTVDGNAVAYNKDGDLVYIEHSNDNHPGKLSPLKVGRDEDTTLFKNKNQLHAFTPRRVTPTEKHSPTPKGRSLYDDSYFVYQDEARAATKESPLKIQNLVVLMRFKDHVDRELPEKNNYEDLFNHIAIDGNHTYSAPTGSVREVYLEHSYGKLDVESRVFGWFTVNFTESECASGDPEIEDDKTITNRYVKLHQAMNEALRNPEIQALNFAEEFDRNNDGRIDMVTFVHSGYDASSWGIDQYGTPYAERIWSHKFSMNLDGYESVDEYGNSYTFTEDNSYVKDDVLVDDYSMNPGVWGLKGFEISRKGVISHEMGHFLGLPDLYDIDYTSGGLAAYGLMADSWGWDATQYHANHFCPWSKVKLGLVEPIELTESQTITLEPVQVEPQIYKITNGFQPNEYLLIENRQQILSDNQMYGAGLLIYHIDDTQYDNSNESVKGEYGKAWPFIRPLVRLVQPDGLFELERFPSYWETYITSDYLSYNGIYYIDSYVPGGLNSYQNELPQCVAQGATSNKTIEILSEEVSSSGLGNKITIRYTHGTPVDCDVDKEYLPTPFPTTEGESTPYPTPESYDSVAISGCVDEPGWLDGESAYGVFKYDCAWFADDDTLLENFPYSSKCAKYGNKFPNENGLTATDACCICGQRNAPTLSPTNSPFTNVSTLSPTKSPFTNAPVMETSESPEAINIVWIVSISLASSVIIGTLCFVKQRKTTSNAGRLGHGSKEEIQVKFNPDDL